MHDYTDAPALASTAPTSGPWIPSSARDVAVMRTLEAVQEFSDSIDRMHGGMRGDMEMNATDLSALRMLMVRERAGESVKPHDIAVHLSITTASTTKLLDRLVGWGYAERRPHPTDRRARVVVLTERAKADFYRHFGIRLRKMRSVMDDFSDDELLAAARLMARISDVIVETSHLADPESILEQPQ